MIGITEDIEKIDYISEFESVSRPLLVKNYAKNWGAFKKWNLDFFKSQYGEYIVDASYKNQYYELSLKEYISYITEIPADHRAMPELYLNWKFQYEASKLSSDYKEPHFITNLFNQKLFDQRIQKQYSWIYVGPKGSGSPLHIDIDNTHGWNALLSGEKEWIFLSPNENEKIKEAKKTIPNLDLFDETILNKLPELNYERLVQEEGDLLIIPSGWWHQVINNDLTIALTENYVNKHNIVDFIEKFEFEEV
ncbi:cupin-like domain-containing protein [Lysinibacillus xylanilyticus]|uniref:cupin-like domain-containing protein n=1 Tax=Lysinibacillus xylanilyticus TaxID=582475 RepID=UPI00382B3F94